MALPVRTFKRSTSSPASCEIFPADTLASARIFSASFSVSKIDLRISSMGSLLFFFLRLRQYRQFQSPAALGLGHDSHAIAQIDRLVRPQDGNLVLGLTQGL